MMMMKNNLRKEKRFTLMHALCHPLRSLYKVAIGVCVGGGIHE